MVRLLVCGSREWPHAASEITQVLDAVKQSLTEDIETVIEGCAEGPDRVSSNWAELRDIPVEHYPAKWLEHGKAAGAIRNKQMLDEGKPNLVIAFWDRKSRGTKNMIDLATAASVPVMLFTPTDAGDGT